MSDMSVTDRQLRGRAGPLTSTAGVVEPRLRGGDDLKTVALQFEALFVGQLLRSARAASLADTPLTGGGDFAGAIDAARAQALATAAPLGVAKLLK